MSPNFIRIATHITIVLLAVVSGILGIADKIAAIPMIPAEWTKYWTILLAGAVALKPVLLVIGDLLDDGVINQSFKESLPLALACLLLTGCATNTGDAAKDRRGRIANAVGSEAATVAWDFILTSGKNYLSGQNGQNAAKAAFSAAKDTVVMYDASAGIARIRAAAGPKVAAAASQAITTANPQTPEQVRMAFNSVGAAFQTAANASVPDNQP